MPATGIKLKIDRARLTRDIKKIKRQFATVEAVGILQAAVGTKRETGKILKRSKELCPVSVEPYYKQGKLITRGGRLKDSGRIVESKGATKKRRDWEITYGGKSVKGIFVDYAAAVHERTDLRHKKGRAKFLETAVKELKPGIAGQVAKVIEKGISAALRTIGL